MHKTRVRPPYSGPEKCLQILSLFALVGLLVLTAVAMPGLPEKIPTHFGINGTPDAWGGKGSMFLLPAMAVAADVLFTVLERFPWTLRYPVEITEENMARQYGLARRVLEWLKCVLTVTLFYGQRQIVRTAKGWSEGLGPWFLPVFLILMLGGIGIQMYRMYRPG